MNLQNIRKKCMVFVLVLPIMLYVSLLYAQPEEILLKHDPEKGDMERTPVLFPHERHMDFLGCLDCHHKYEKGENVLDEGELEDGNPAAQCMTCHSFKSNCDIQKVFHQQCLTCHVKKDQAGEKKGPRQCNGCHKPQEGQQKLFHVK